MSFIELSGLLRILSVDLQSALAGQAWADEKVQAQRRLSCGCPQRARPLAVL